MNITKEADREQTSGNQFGGKGNIGVREWELQTIGYKPQKDFINYEVGDSKKLFFHVREVQDGTELQAGDELEFSVILNQRTGKCSACNVWRVCEGPKAVAAPRPDRLVNRLKNITLDDASAPRLMVLRQPRGPDNSMGFGAERKIRQAGVID
nr:cold shock domain-containing protein E1 [Odocoileus virginianus texanus]